jgi:hypothetical protein
VNLPKLVNEIIVLPTGTGGRCQLVLNIALLIGEILTPPFVLGIRAIAGWALLVLIALIRIPLILLWRIIRLALLRCRSGYTGHVGQRDRDPRLLLRQSDRTRQDRRNGPSDSTQVHCYPRPQIADRG